MRAINPGALLTLAQTDSVFVVCKGHLSNRPAIIMRVGGCAARPDAELLLAMYTKVGALSLCVASCCVWWVFVIL